MPLTSMVSMKASGTQEGTGGVGCRWRGAHRPPVGIVDAGVPEIPGGAELAPEFRFARGQKILSWKIRGMSRFLPGSVSREGGSMPFFSIPSMTSS